MTDGSSDCANGTDGEMFKIDNNGVPRGGSTRVLPVERLCTSREDLRTLLPFHPKNNLAAAANNETAKQELHTAGMCFHITP